MSSGDTNRMAIIVSLGILALASAGSAFECVQSSKTDHTITSRIVCYFANWADERPGIRSYSIDDIPGDKCTHIVYAFVGVSNVTWEVLVLDEQNDILNNGFWNFTALKKKWPHLRTLLAVGGWNQGGQNISQMLSVPTRRKTFMNSILDYTINYGFDGIDVNFGYPAAMDLDWRFTNSESFRHFIWELSYAKHTENKILEITLALPLAIGRVQYGYVYSICKYVDAIHLMTTNQRDNWIGTEENDSLYSELDNMEESLTRWGKFGCPKQKLIVGVLFYGSSYHLVESSNSSPKNPVKKWEGGGVMGPYEATNNIKAYYQICEYVNSTKYDWTHRQYDGAGLVLNASKGNNMIVYEDPISLKLKMDWIKLQGYGGAMIWALDQDDFTGVCGTVNPLITSVYNQMKDYYVYYYNVQLSWSMMCYPSRPWDEDYEYPWVRKTTASPIQAEPQANESTENPNIHWTWWPTTNTTTTRVENQPITEAYVQENKQDYGCKQKYYTHNDCRKYYHCQHGKLVVKTCMGESVWDPEMNICNWPSQTRSANCK